MELLGRLRRLSFRKLTSLEYWRQKIHEALLAITVRPVRVGPRGYLHPIEEKCLYRAACRVARGGRIVEVGSYYGRSASLMALGIKAAGNGAHIWCVDTWRNTAVPDEPADIYEEFLRNIDPLKDVITPLRGCSEEVARRWSGPIDLLFIDGDHSFEGCRRDIECWAPFVRPGGWVMFHDTGLEEVQRATDACAYLLPSRARLRAWSLLLIRKR